jgi:hypothetical protein
MDSSMKRGYRKAWQARWYIVEKIGRVLIRLVNYGYSQGCDSVRVTGSWEQSRRIFPWAIRYGMISQD